MESFTAAMCLVRGGVHVFNTWYRYRYRYSCPVHDIKKTTATPIVLIHDVR